MFRVPSVDAGQVDVLPTQGRDVLQQMIWNLATFTAQMGNRPLYVNCIPMHDRADDEVQA